jgi:hypothetical protein
LTLAPEVALPSPASIWLRLELTAALLTAAAASLVLAVGPSPADAAAHLYRTFLVRHGVLVWDNLWFGGHYPLASYSLLYYFPAAVVGNLPLVFTAVVVSTILFAGVAYHEWGQVAVWPTRVFAVFAAAPLFTGSYSYALGFAALLGALRAAQKGQMWVTILLSGLTLGFSPLAFTFLVLIFAAVLIARRTIERRTVLLAAALLALGALQVVVLEVFPSPGVYPFHAGDLLAVLAVCLLGALLARRAVNGGPLVAFFILWAFGSLVAYAAPTSIGDNWTRLRGFVFPIMLLAALLVRFRPRLLAAAALAAGLAYNLVPFLQQIPYRTDVRPESAAFWDASIDFLRGHSSADYRVEVVPTAEHWETYWLPRAGIPIARGWYRQLDIVDNPPLYRHSLSGASYRRWLRQMGVKYVLVPGTRLDPVGGTDEAQLLRSGVAGLRLVYATRSAAVYRLANPTPLLTGPSPAQIASIGHSSVTGWVAAPGRYFFRERYTPYYKVGPAGCAVPTKSQLTWLVLRHPGPFTLKVSRSAEAILTLAVDGDSKTCASAAARTG